MNQLLLAANQWLEILRKDTKMKSIIILEVSSIRFESGPYLSDDANRFLEEIWIGLHEENFGFVEDRIKGFMLEVVKND